MELLILAQGFIMARVNYFLFIGFIYLLQGGFIVCIFNACIFDKFSPGIGGISLCYYPESFKVSQESSILFPFKQLFGPLRAGPLPSHPTAHHHVLLAAYSYVFICRSFGLFKVIQEIPK